MEPEKHTITSLEQFHKTLRYVRNNDGTGWWFRGQSDKGWPLLPKAGRTEFYLPDDRDLGRFNAWQHDAYPFLKLDLKNDFEMLAYAQHHELATRLLDWTANPLIATYFACTANLGTDGVIYCYSPETFINLETASISQKNLHGAGLITKAFDGRMLNQKGLFTFHSPSNAPIEIKPISYIPDHPNLMLLIIPAELKNILTQQLKDYGITEHFIYPDIDGVARSINVDTAEMAEQAARKT
jgi:hypothetical protein